MKERFIRARIRVWSGGSALKTLGMNSSSGISGGGDQPGTFLESLDAAGCRSTVKQSS